MAIASPLGEFWAAVVDQARRMVVVAVVEVLGLTLSSVGGFGGRFW